MTQLAAGLEFRDWDEALVWLERARALGDEEACDLLQRVPRKKPFVLRTKFLAGGAESQDIRVQRRERRRIIKARRREYKLKEVGDG